MDDWMGEINSDSNDCPHRIYCRALEKEIERLKQTQMELWRALTPEKRHELNLKWKELSDG